jgi:hypothetical protein
LKGVTKKALAEHFGVEPPSVQDWVKRGTIDKARLPELWNFFSDVVGPDHWGLPWAGVQGSPISLSSALERLGIELARDMPADVREDVADALHKLALRRGQERDQTQVLALLGDSGTKHSSAG